MSENLLRHETSPYLLQHKDNPVHWRPWGEAALAEARARDVPLLVSVGYSTCYWCHVMERESFEDEATAAVMNERFVCVKVDREERPDVDQLYMTAVQVQTRQGGWPMNVFLLPDGRYFYGGTYFPPREMHGRPSFTNVLTALSDAYQNDRAEVEEQAGQIEEILRKLAEPAKPERAVTLDLETLVAIERAGRSDFDEQHGGFGGAPKFPRQTLLQLALRMQRLSPDPERERQIKATLDALAAGGIRDHLGGGFHRYSTDAKWLVPHFEIMLYDQAMLLDVFTDAAEQFDDAGYLPIAEGIAGFVGDELTAATGGFFSGIDAEVNAREGQNYLWTEQQVRDTVEGQVDAEHVDRFVNAFGLADGPNFSDPHHDHGVKTANVLFVPAAGAWRSAIVDESFGEIRRLLFDARAKRDQPITDTKVITSWNALTISGLCRLAEVGRSRVWIDLAKRAADFLLDAHRDGGHVMRTSKDGVVRHRGLLDDYAYLAAACLDLAEATGEARYRDDAAELANAIGRLFGGGGSDGGGPWFSPLEADDLYVRQKVAGDNPLPSGAAVYGDVLRRLGRVEAAVAVVADLGGAVVQQVGSACTLTKLAADLAADGHAVDVEASEEERPMSPEQVAEAGVQVAGQWTNGRTLALTLAVAPGHHVGGLAAELPTVVNVVGFGDASVTMPDGETLAGNVEATVRFPRDMGDVAKLQLAVRYQLCRDDACLPPVTRTLNVLGPAAKTTACGGGGCGEEGCACVSD